MKSTIDAPYILFSFKEKYYVFTFIRLQNFSKYFIMKVGMPG